MNSNERNIPFEYLGNRGIQKEEKENFDNSFFKEIYDQAKNLTKVIIEENRRFDDSEEIYLQKTADMQNIIAFIGRRGTGKTSAMLTFAEYLAKGCTYMEDEYHDLYYENKFFVLQYVDTSAIYKGEDFFEILLFRMLQYLKNFSESNLSYNNQRVNAELDDLKGNIARVYSHYVNLLQDKFDDSASFSRMEAYISKHDVRHEFRILVSEFNEFLSNYSSSNSNKKGFLVLCIDDIDMSRQDHLQLLQCLHQYFMIPGVIVYITLNFNILTANLKKSFYESMSINVSKEQEYLLSLSTEQTNDFLKKIIPSDMRITMPSWKKYDYKQLSDNKIILKNSNMDKKIDLKKIFPNLDGCDWCLSKDRANDISPKLFIMKLLADRTKIFLDPKGYKHHFMEPDSLRNLYDIFYLLYNMQNICGKDKNGNGRYSHTKCEYNRKILLDYLNFKMIPELELSSEESRIIKIIQSEPMSRRGRRIWEYYFKRLNKNEECERIKHLYNNDNNNFIEKENEKHKISNYNIGELFRILYFGSRLDLFSKDFVKAVLASYAFAMPQLVEKEKQHKNEYDVKRFLEFVEKHLNDEGKKQLKEKLRIEELDEQNLADFFNMYRKNKANNEENLGEKLLNSLEKIKKIGLKNKEAENAKEAWCIYILKYGDDHIYADAYFYDFRELKEVFGYSMLGQWNDDLSNQLSINPIVKIRLSKNDIPKICILDEKVIEYNDFNGDEIEKFISTLIDDFMLISDSSKNKIFIETENVPILKVNIDPTAFIFGNIKVSRILNFKFNIEPKTFNLGSLILSYLNDTHIKKNSSTSNKENIFKKSAYNLQKHIVAEVIKKYFDMPQLNWFLLKHIDITYNAIKRTITKFLYLSDESLQTIPLPLLKPSIDIKFKDIYNTFYKRFKEKMEDSVNEFSDTKWCIELLEEEKPYTFKFFLLNNSDNKSLENPNSFEEATKEVTENSDDGITD